MIGNDEFAGKNDYLRRLGPEYYRGMANVHWSMTVDCRKTGWRIPIVYYKFREILTHTAFRYGLCCPIYCLMPDHTHLLWMGLCSECDQRLAAKFSRRHFNPVLEKLGARFQKQAHDHVLCDADSTVDALENTWSYIAANPERAGLVAVGHFREYRYTECLVPGYPELSVWQSDFWPRFWRICSYLKQHGFKHGPA